MENSKYEPLWRHLTALDVHQWCATFKEIESILGFSLPKSARLYPPWWANERNGRHSHARAWLLAGWQTCAPDLKGETLVFKRSGPSVPTSIGSGRRSLRKGRRFNADEQTRRNSETAPVLGTAGTIALGGHAFQHCAHIRPQAGPDGKPLEDMPQHRYAAACSTPLNRHGEGPFCRFTVSGLPPAPGLYAITVARKLVYVGIAIDLKRRWGSSDYARIQPRNCYRDGQSTNCKVNHAILVAAQDGLAIDLWIHQAAKPRPLEERLIAELAPPWNDQR